MAECANPHFLGWVKGMVDEARARNMKIASTYKKAYDSLKACPLRFEHPSELQALNGFGPKTCDRLIAKLQEHCEEEGIPMPQVPHKKRKKPASKDNGNDDDDDATPSPAKKPRKTKPYVPGLRTGPYALILALATLGRSSSRGLTKQELIEIAQPYTDSSFTHAEPGKFYTAWASMKTLETKELVYKRGRPNHKFLLTEEGWEVAEGIQNTLNPSQRRLDDYPRQSPQSKGRGKEAPDDFQDISPSPSRSRHQPSESPKKRSVQDLVPQGTSTDLPTFTPITLPPGTFTVELVLDIREIRAKSDRDYMQKELEKKGVKPIMRALELGDVLWVAKLHNPNLLSNEGAEGDEVFLDWIVERKRLDDLVSSIKDGRFHEQKFRLKKGGVKNVVYLIEEINTNDDYLKHYGEAMESAIASTQVVNGFFVKKTQRMDDTIRYLKRMTMVLKNIYEDKHLQVVPTPVITSKNYIPLVNHLRETQPGTDYHITYSAFASLVSKSESLTQREIFLKMLMSIRGVTGEKAIEMQRHWKTPADFIEAFENCGAGEQGRKKRLEMVSGKMGNNITRKKIAKAVSTRIAEVWGDEEYA